MIASECLLSAQDVDSYRELGYLLKEELFSPQECDRLLRIFEQHAEKDYPAIMNLDRAVPEVRGLMKDPRCVSVLEALKGAEMVALVSQALFKRVGTPYASQAWNPHQDNSYAQAPAGTSMTLMIFLADSDVENCAEY